MTIDTVIYALSGGCTLALIGLALLYGKYRGKAAEADAALAVARVKDAAAVQLRLDLARREVELAAARARELEAKSAKELVEELRALTRGPVRS